MRMRFTKLNYFRQYLLSSLINYTITNLAEHLEQISHDAINYYLQRAKLTPRLLWENVKDIIEGDANGYIIFDGSVLDKGYSQEIEIVRRQYSGNEHGVVKGIGVVSCVTVYQIKHNLLSNYLIQQLKRLSIPMCLV